MLTTNTWCPLFSGFYNTIWECDNEESEIDYINEQRQEKGFTEEVNYDHLEIDYNEYRQDVSKEACGVICGLVVEKGFIAYAKFQELRSPREYNFTTDSINIEVSMDDKNVKAITEYLNSHLEQFKKYIEDRYTSRSGFMSSYSNDYKEWLLPDCLEHEHKLGSILEFILKNEEIDETEDIFYECGDVTSTVPITNFDKLVETKKLAELTA